MANILLLTIFLPLVGAVGIWPIAKFGGRDAVRWWALLTTLATFGLACWVVWGFFQSWTTASGEVSQYFAWTNTPWLGAASGIDIRFAFSLDGISLWLFALSALLMVTSVLVSWSAIKQNPGLFYAMLLLLETGCLGVFSAQDILLFYVFFEFTLIPLFFLIGVWGSENRRYAAVKFFIYTLTGSVLTFLGLLTIVFWSGGYLGTAGAWNSGIGTRPTMGKPLPLTFEIHALEFRLNSDHPQNSQYARMLEVAEHPQRRNRRIDAREATEMPPHRIARARKTFDDAVFFKYDTNRDGALSYEELLAGRTEADRVGLDLLFTTALFLRLNQNGNETLEVDELAALAADGTADATKKLLAELGIESDTLAKADIVDIGGRRWANATGFVVTKSDLSGFSPAMLDRYGAWSFGPKDLRKMDFWLQMWIFLALFIGFAIKVPLFPLHTWLPLAHVQAPTAGSVFLAGILLKIGTYGFLRFNIPLLPDATAAAMPCLLWLSVAGIIYGALVALAQSDIKKLIAYSSVSHLGFCMLGLFALNALGTQGALLQMFNHGISTGALFALVGMLYERYHTRQIKDLSGIARTAPWMAFFMIVFTMSSIGLPGLNGFAGEFLILIGMFQRAWTDAPPLLALQYKVISVLAVAGVVLGAWYMLWLVQRVFFGPLKTPPLDDHDTDAGSPTGDLNFREIAALAPLAVLALWIGLWPGFFLKPMQTPLKQQTAAARKSVDTLIKTQSALASETIQPTTDAESLANATKVKEADAEADHES